jgi:hypothetical protein
MTMFRHLLFRKAKDPSSEADENLLRRQIAQRAKSSHGDHAPMLLSLQRRIGNRAVTRLLRHQESQGTEEARAMQAKLGQGHSLDGSTKSRMQSALGADLSDVRVHTDSEAAQLARQQGAHAFTVGEDIAFDKGNYKPGTPLGDALLAHELAHVVQQSHPTEASISAQRGSATYGALEREADSAALGVIGSLGYGLRGAVRSMASAVHQVRPAMRAGLSIQMASCFSSRRKIDPPKFLGPKSRETFEIIRHRLETADILEDMLIAGPLIILLTSSPLETAAAGGYPLQEQVDAVRAVDVIVRSRVQQDIDLLLVLNGNDLTEEERRYWERLRDVLTQARTR